MKRKQHKVRHLFFGTGVFLSLVLAAPVAVADWEELIDRGIEEAKAKLGQVSKDGLSASEVKSLTDKLNQVAGDDIQGTGVGELLNLMNHHADQIAKASDAKDKLDSTIDLVEKLAKATKPDENGNLNGEATMLALASGIKLAEKLVGAVPGVNILVVPMLNAYGQAIENGATNVATIQERADQSMLAIEQTKIGADREDDSSSDDDGTPSGGGFYARDYPYPTTCRECEENWITRERLKNTYDQWIRRDYYARLNIRLYGKGHSELPGMGRRSRQDLANEAEDELEYARTAWENQNEVFETCLAQCLQNARSESQKLEGGLVDKAFNELVKGYLYLIAVSVSAQQSNILTKARDASIESVIPDDPLLFKDANGGREKLAYELTESSKDETGVSLSVWFRTYPWREDDQLHRVFLDGAVYYHSGWGTSETFRRSDGSTQVGERDLSGYGVAGGIGYAVPIIDNGPWFFNASIGARVEENTIDFESRIAYDGTTVRTIRKNSSHFGIEPYGSIGLTFVGNNGWGGYLGYQLSRMTIDDPNQGEFSDSSSAASLGVSKRF